MSFSLTYKNFGDQAVLVEWPAVISEAVLEDIVRFKSVIAQEKIEGILELRLAYNSILVIFNPLQVTQTVLSEKLKDLYLKDYQVRKSVSKIWTIPVCYDEHFGVDLKEISVLKQLPVSEIISRHTAALYTVYFIGFLPGFLYLGGLDERLHVPRKHMPRLKIETGAVAIGGSQTGIYPMASPGGWNIIGNSPVSFFDKTRAEPCFAKSGDKIKFKSVSQSEYNDIQLLVAQGVYQPENEIYHD
ncbi:5-oxoprolinase subunit PxpB [Formosa sp. S-31]|uniref:5-oxoprolinase subunit PxpB n=1 Tax=Formosa sp. S-31 TaxID=2790949 RepID=UPI003EBFE3A6